MMKRKPTLFALVVLSMVGWSAPVEAQHATTNTRVFWIDRDTQKLSWGDIVTTDKWSLKTGSVQGFPEGISQETTLGPLDDRNGIVIAGVSDTTDGESEGRWVAIDPGVFQRPHGNHFHWEYSGRPNVTQTLSDKGQGETVRTETGGDQVYLLSQNGFGFANVNNLKTRGTTTNANQFIPTSNRPMSHLAVVNNAVAYSTWSDKEGDHAGQVDVIQLASPAKPAYSFKLPSGGISATTVSGGKVFFAHPNAISWIAADIAGTQRGDQVKINTVALPADPPLDLSSPPKSLLNEKDVVLFTTGTGAAAKLCLIEAAGPRPFMTVLPIPTSEGLQLSAPSTVLSLGKRYAFVFQQRSDAKTNTREQLSIIELDPNRDLRFDDARIAKTMPVGSSKVQGSSGTHQVCFDDYGRFAIYTNPGEGTLSVITMHDLQLRVNFKVGGVPTEIVAVGAPEHFH